MAEAVVDQFEVVEVEEQYGDFLFCRPDLLNAWSSGRGTATDWAGR